MTIQITRIKFLGHANILSTHQKTLEITKDQHLTRRGDCIIGVSAEKACADLDEELKKILQRDGSIANITIQVDGESFTFKAFGSSKLKMTHPREIVIRKTNFTNCTRTIAIRSEAAASDIPRTIITKLRSGLEGFLVIEAT